MVDAKVFLNRAKHIDRQINSKQEQKEKLWALATKTTTKMRQELIARTNQVERSSNIVDKIIEIDAEIDAQIDALVDIKKETMRAISKVDDPMSRVVLEYIYLLGKTTSEVAAMLNYSTSWVKEKHADALNCIHECL